MGSVGLQNIRSSLSLVSNLEQLYVLIAVRLETAVECEHSNFGRGTGYVMANTGGRGEDL